MENIAVCDSQQNNHTVYKMYMINIDLCFMTGGQQWGHAVVLGHLGVGPVLCAEPPQDAAGEAPGNLHLHRGRAQDVRQRAGQACGGEKRHQ